MSLITAGLGPAVPQIPREGPWAGDLGRARRRGGLGVVGLRGGRRRHSSSEWAEAEIFQALFIASGEGRLRKAASLTRVFAREGERLDSNRRKSWAEMELLRVQPLVGEGRRERLTLHRTTTAMPAKKS